MDEMLPEEITAIRASVRRFMETEVLPVLDDYEARRQLPRDLIMKAGEAGFYGSTFPESVGGTNFGYLAAVVIPPPGKLRLTVHDGDDLDALPARI